jgi:antitoxin ParD1/3/4
MSDQETITLELPRSVADALRTAVASGDYGSPGDVLRDALQLWQDQREMLSLAELRQAYREGKESGIAGPLDIEGLIARARAGFGRS